MKKEEWQKERRTEGIRQNERREERKKQRRAFSVIGPSTWTELPLTLRLLPRNNVSSFCLLLKKFLLGRSWTESASE